MNVIIETTIARALKMLDSTGCAYAVIKPDGSEAGILEIVRPKVRKPRVVRNNFKVTGYVGKIAAMKIGDVLVLDAGILPVEDFRSAVSSTLMHRFGKGSCTTCVVGTTVQALRME